MSGGKLVRDRVPDLIRTEGRRPDVIVLDDLAFAAELRRKLVEEAYEAVAATGDGLLEELADVLEVVRTLASEQGLDLAAVLAAADAKVHERGGFAERLFLRPERSSS